VKGLSSHTFLGTEGRRNGQPSARSRLSGGESSCKNGGGVVLGGYSGAMAPTSLEFCAHDVGDSCHSHFSVSLVSPFESTAERPHSGQRPDKFPLRLYPQCTQKPIGGVVRRRHHKDAADTLIRKRNTRKNSCSSGTNGMMSHISQAEQKTRNVTMSKAHFISNVTSANPPRAVR